MPVKNSYESGGFPALSLESYAAVVWQSGWAEVRVWWWSRNNAWRWRSGQMGSWGGGQMNPGQAGGSMPGGFFMGPDMSPPQRPDQSVFEAAGRGDFYSQFLIQQYQQQLAAYQAQMAQQLQNRRQPGVTPGRPDDTSGLMGSSSSGWGRR